MTTESHLPPAAEEYIRTVLKHIPPPLPERDRIAMELRSHLEERIAGGAPVDDAVARMGPAEEVAREYLAQVEFTDASVLERTGAFVLDLALGVMVLSPGWIGLWFLITRMRDVENLLAIPVFPIAFFFSVVVLAVAVLSVIYFPVMEAIYGHTLGKRLVGIYVTQEKGEAVGWVPAILRRLPFLLEIFWIDAIFALFTKRNQRAFDLVARTVVVRR